MSGLADFFSSTGFLPHGVCLFWRPDILALHAVSDVLIAVAYFSIPLAIQFFVRRRKDLIAEHRRIAVLFSLFIMSCGLTHLMSVVLLWVPLYVFDGLLKAFTALVSVITAFVLWPVLPRLLEIPSPRQLTDANVHLQAEMEAKQAAMTALEAHRVTLEAEVERRVREVDSLARRFRIATEGSLVTVTEQDADLRYLWVHNPAPPLTDDIIGQTDEAFLEPAAASKLVAAKREALASGQASRTELVVDHPLAPRYFDLRITPTKLHGEAPGLLIATIDITEQRRQQEHLEVLMRELAHRAKNLLSLVEGVARQTARAEGLPEAFIKRFSARLSALGSAHDLLISHNWAGVEIGMLIRAQLAFIMPEAADRIELSGPSLMISPQVGQYLALALHELATNATKHGVFSQVGGALSISWRLSEAPDRVIKLTWREQGVPVKAPARKGFGRILLETIVPRALSGGGTLDFTSQGIVWSVTFAA
jgi:two-component sensor histidine kinase